MAINQPGRKTLAADATGNLWIVSANGEIWCKKAITPDSNMRTWDSLRDANGWYTLLLDTLVGHELLLTAPRGIVPGAWITRHPACCVRQRTEVIAVTVLQSYWTGLTRQM